MRVAWANQNSLNVFYTNLDIVEALGFERRVPQTLAEFEEISCAAGASEMYQGYPLDTGTFHTLRALWPRMAAPSLMRWPASTSLNRMRWSRQWRCSRACWGMTAPISLPSDTRILATSPSVSRPSPPAVRPAFPSSPRDAATAEMTDEWVISAFPGAEGVGPTLQLFVPSQILLTATPEGEVATWLFVRFLAGAEAQLAWSGATGYFSIRNDIEVTADDFTEPRMPFERFVEVQGILQDADLSVYSSPGLPSYSAVRGLVPNVIAEVVNGDAEAAAALAELNEETAELHDDLDM